MLGEIHWHILRASRQMYKKTIVETRHGESGIIVQHGITEFGKEVGRDEIDWWVFRKEDDIQVLKKRTGEALDAAQKLKRRRTFSTEARDLRLAASCSRYCGDSQRNTPPRLLRAA